MDLPLFPLHLVLYPGRPLPLHLFEMRYRDMLRDCLAGDGLFGVVAIRSGREVGTDWTTGKSHPPADPSPPTQPSSSIYAVGTITKIRTVSERDDGRFDIITVGSGRFRVRETLNDRSYLHADVDELDESEEPQDVIAAEELRTVLLPYLKGLGVPEEFCERLPTSPAELSYLACSALQVEVPIQQGLLELPTHAERMLATAKIIRREAGIIRHLGAVGSFRPPGPGGAQLN
ncbi:LON peptidase substrate-binding domain-containing protein [Euzebya tangerina]|uniref:LON peptidase substrate-binding domain-containing protein n=1 Tax=Euzebya tangerina TaxID=591198 RepID=UPI0013C32161|nr:LON peptidase substrate-binding domain-containing protein [Euzebya tangerina]